MAFADECIKWEGRLSPSGYGQFCRWGEHWQAHRWSWACVNGDIPKGMVIDHVCRRRDCINPEHLRLVTPKTNATENSVSPSALNKQKTHCIHGHALVPDNIYLSRGRRHCRACLRESQRRFNRRKRAAK